MNITGLDYNTKRERLIMPEYGREIQNMVNHALTIEDRQQRQLAAEKVVRIMKSMNPGTGDEQEQKYWDHLAILANFKLDIDYPFDISQAQNIAQSPEPLSYPTQDIPVRHYGKMLFETFNRLKTMPEGPERDALVEITANHMKRSLAVWSNGSWDDEKVADDLFRFTDGAIQIDLESFQFAKLDMGTTQKPAKNKKKKK